MSKNGRSLLIHFLFPLSTVSQWNFEAHKKRIQNEWNCLSKLFNIIIKFTLTKFRNGAFLSFAYVSSVGIPLAPNTKVRIWQKLKESVRFHWFHNCSDSKSQIPYPIKSEQKLSMQYQHRSIDFWKAYSTMWEVIFRVQRTLILCIELIIAGMKFKIAPLQSTRRADCSNYQRWINTKENRWFGR